MSANVSPRMTISTRNTGVSEPSAINGILLPPGERQKDTAQYIADMILELRNMAKANQLFQVMVPLEYAYYEAFAVANKVEAPPEEVERLNELSKMSENIENERHDY